MTAARKPSRRHEAPEIGAAARRFIRSLVRRGGEGDTEALEQLRDMQAFLQAAITECGQAMHDEAGYSYTDLAKVMGISRQGARQRFTTPPAPVDPHAGLASLLDEVPA